MKRLIFTAVVAALMAPTMVTAKTEPLTMGLTGPGTPVAGVPNQYVGRLAIQHTTPIAGATIELFLNDSYHSQGVSDLGGRVTFPITFDEPGHVLMRAVSYRGTLLETARTIGVIVGAEADLSVSMASSKPRAVGEEFAVPFTVGNHGPSRARNVVVTLAVSGNGEVVDTGGACVLKSGGAECTYPLFEALLFGGPSVFVRGTSPGGMTVSVLITGDDFDPDLSNNFDQVHYPLAEPPPFVLLNEVDYNQAGVDTQEWVEIVGEPGASLDGVSLLFYDHPGGVYRSEVLTGATIGPDGYYVVHSSNRSIRCSGRSFAGASTDIIQNGGGAGDAVILYYEALKIVLDAVVYGGGFEIAFFDNGDHDLVQGSHTTAVDSGVDSIGRLPNAIDTGNDAADWQVTAPTPCFDNTPMPQ